ncbi:MAG: hypothetical protein NWF14_06930 [Candidatus Bathyarchaeota archaeon]|nr:hypothetical protein [Candidatus Bathyarchaeota archaeon]
MNGKIVRVGSWEAFKQLIIKHQPRSIIYNIQRGVPAGHLKGLRLILPTKGTQYVFIDTSDDSRLRKTGIPLHKDESGNVYVKEEDVINFVRSESKRKDLALHSYWTI